MAAGIKGRTQSLEAFQPQNDVLNDTGEVLFTSWTSKLQLNNKPATLSGIETDVAFFGIGLFAVPENV